VTAIGWFCRLCPLPGVFHFKDWWFCERHGAIILASIRSPKPLPAYVEDGIPKTTVRIPLGNHDDRPMTNARNKP